MNHKYLEGNTPFLEMNQYHMKMFHEVLNLVGSTLFFLDDIWRGLDYFFLAPCLLLIEDNIS